MCCVCVCVCMCVCRINSLSPAWPSIVYTYCTSRERFKKDKIRSPCHRLHELSVYLDLDGPWEVTDVDVKGNIWVAPEGELLTGEAVSVFLDVRFGHDGHLLSRNGSSCRDTEFTFSRLAVDRDGKSWTGCNVSLRTINGFMKQHSHRQ